MNDNLTYRDGQPAVSVHHAYQHGANQWTHSLADGAHWASRHEATAAAIMAAKRAGIMILTGHADKSLVRDAGLSFRDSRKNRITPGAKIRARIIRNQRVAAREALKPAAMFIPKTEEEAIDWITPLLDLKDFRTIRRDALKRAWWAIFFLYPGLHPDGSLDTGESIEESAEVNHLSDKIDKRLLAPYWRKNGWPVILTPIAREAFAWRQRNVLTADEYYPSEAQRAGWEFRSKKS